MRLLILVSMLRATLGTSSIHSHYYWTISEGFQFCYLRLNATHSFGCASSNRGSNIGVVFLMMSEAEAKKFKSARDVDYIILMSMKNFADSQLMTALNQDKRVKGVVIFEPQKASDRPQSFSVDSRCPNSKRSVYGPQRQCSGVDWNPPGTDYFFTRWNFPIVFFPTALNRSTTRIIQCAEKFNSEAAEDARRCALEVRSEMSAFHSSRMCSRRNHFLKPLIPELDMAGSSMVCDPVVGHNFIYAFAPQTGNTTRRTVVVVARLDALSLFSSSSFGSFAVYPAVSMLVTLAATFARLPESQPSKKRILFALLDGESSQNMGSTCLVRDMQRGALLRSQLGSGIQLGHIHSVLELGQLGSGTLSNAFFAHTSDASKTANVDAGWTQKLKKSAAGVGVSIEAQKAAVLPPASAQVLLRGSAAIGAVLLSDFQASYRNRFYHSLLDDEAAVNESTLHKLTEAVFRALYEEAFEVPPSSRVNETIAKEVTTCFYNISGCRLLKEASLSTPQVTERGPMLDASVRASVLPNPLGKAAHQLLFYLSGQKAAPSTKAACSAERDKDFPKRTYRWLRGPGQGAGGVCWRSLVAEMAVTAPHFEDWQSDWDTSGFAYWAESKWPRVPLVRLFVEPSKSWVAMELCVGVLLTLLAIPLVVFLQRNAQVIFPAASCGAGEEPVA